MSYTNPSCTVMEGMRISPCGEPGDKKKGLKLQHKDIDKLLETQMAAYVLERCMEAFDG